MTLTGGGRPTTDDPSSGPRPFRRSPTEIERTRTTGSRAPSFWRSFTGIQRKRNAGSGAPSFWRSFTGIQRKWNAGSGRGWAALLVFGVVGVIGVVLSARVAAGGPLLTVRWRLLVALVVWAVAWVVGVAAAFRLSRRVALPLIFVVALALRLAALAGPPTTTDDFYRYSWDGRVQAAGLDPYRYTPSSPELAHLREPWLWPVERPCPLAYRPDACTRINRPSAPTIYPPLAEAWFAGVYRLAGVEARWKPWQVAGLVTDVAVVAALATALRRRGRDPRWVGLYALCPAPVLEIVNNGHVDGLAILLAVGALMAASERRHVAAGALIGAAALVKLFPVLLVVPVVAATAGRRGRTLLRVGAAAAGRGGGVGMGAAPGGTRRSSRRRGNAAAGRIARPAVVRRHAPRLRRPGRRTDLGGGGGRRVPLLHGRHPPAPAPGRDRTGGLRAGGDDRRRRSPAPEPPGRRP